MATFEGLLGGEAERGSILLSHPLPIVPNNMNGSKHAGVSDFLMVDRRQGVVLCVEGCCMAVTSEFNDCSLAREGSLIPDESLAFWLAMTSPAASFFS
uniref:Uncharacterized protein n=1 Tax=Oryza brachyantha TaxID=4533 RepID=J3KV84_ORYBR